MSTFRKPSMILCLWMLCASPCLAQEQYIVTDLGWTQYGLGPAVNNNGQVVGSDYNGQKWNGYLYSNGTVHNIGGFSGGYTGTIANAINDYEQIVGQSNIGMTWNAFLWQGSNFQNIGTLGGIGSVAYGVNDSGTIVGESNLSGAGGPYHAFISNGMVTQDMGTLGGDSSAAYAINNNGWIVGQASTSGNADSHAFLYRNGSMQDLGTLDGNSSIAYAVNNNGSVVGQSGSHAFLYIGSTMQDLGTLGGNFSTAYSINGSGYIVGASNINSDSGYYHAFLNKGGGQIQDLNTMIDPSSGWILNKATSINAKGQIVGSGVNSTGQNHAFLLTPVGNCLARQAEPPSTDCLRKWNSATSKWEPIAQGELSSKNVHVIVHGWGAGLREFANDGGHIWNANDPITEIPTNQEGYNMITKMATAINSKSSSDVIVAFDWLDKSATDSNSPTEAWKSRAETDGAADLLKSSLDSVCNLSTGFTGKLQLIGFSHGARVAAVATEKLYNGGNSGSIVVDQLTFCDSPDNSVSGIPMPENWKLWKTQWHGAENNLGDVLKNLPIGRTSNTTFVDNYCSLLGIDYTNSNSVVNVKLFPEEHGVTTDVDAHGYAMDWYTGATSTVTNPDGSVALVWSPLSGDIYKTLDSKYLQSVFNQYGLVSSENPISILEGAIRAFKPSPLGTTGTVNTILNGINLLENSPAYWHSSFMMNDNDKTLEFSYKWENAGDGDQLSIWIDDEMRFVVTGNLSGANNITTDIDISNLGPGSHILSVALNNYGSTNASVNVTDFKLISYPHELVWTGSASGVWDNNATVNFTGSTSGKFIDDDIATFDDTGSLSEITIAAEGVNPSNVWFLNTTAKDYTLTGGPINAVNLIVAGGGEVTLGDVNCSKTILVTNGSTLTASSIVCSTLIIGGDNTLSAVPEPSVLILLLLGIPFAMVFWKRMKK